MHCGWKEAQDTSGLMAFSAGLNQHSCPRSSAPHPAQPPETVPHGSASSQPRQKHDRSVLTAECWSRSHQSLRFSGHITEATWLLWLRSGAGLSEAASFSPLSFKWEKTKPENKWKSPPKRPKHWSLLTLSATCPPAMSVSKDLPENPSLLTPEQRLCIWKTELLWVAMVFELLSKKSLHSGAVLLFSSTICKLRLTTEHALPKLNLTNYSGTGKMPAQQKLMEFMPWNRHKNLFFLFHWNTPKAGID